MRREGAEQARTRDRHILSAARRLHRALVVGQGAPEDFYGAEALFVRTLRSHLEVILKALEPYLGLPATSAAAQRAAEVARGILRGMMLNGVKGGFNAAVDPDGRVDQGVLRRLLDIDQDVGCRLLHLIQVMKRLKRSRTAASINQALGDLHALLTELREALTMRRKLAPGPPRQLK